MGRRSTKRLRLKHRKTRRRNRRSTRRMQKGGWGGMNMYQPKEKQRMSMMYGGWGQVINGV